MRPFTSRTHPNPNPNPQAMVNGRWMDLDATLHVPYSVGHVLVGTSSMSDKEAHNNHMQVRVHGAGCRVQGAGRWVRGRVGVRVQGAGCQG